MVNQSNPNCRIGLIKPKNGGAEIRVFEPRHVAQRAEVKFGFGRVIIEYDGDGNLDNATQVYLLEAAKEKIMFNKVGD